MTKEKLESLKAQVYDKLVERQKVEQDLAELNSQIAILEKK